MEIAKLILEYLTLFLSWPVVLGVLVGYFLKWHGSTVDSILKRMTSISLPGGVTIDTTAYPPEPTVPPPIPRREGGPQFSPKDVGPLEQLNKDFSGFLWQGTELNRVAVGIEIDRLWIQLKASLFPPATIAGSEDKTHSEKLRAMKDIYKIDGRAISDFDFLESVTKDKPRQTLMVAYNKSGVLRWYFSGLAVRK